MNLKPFPLIAYCLIMLCAGCSRDELPAVQAEVTSSEPPAPEAVIKRIPLLQPEISFAARPLPYPEEGLRFQRAERPETPAMKWMQPMGDARFGPDGNLFMSFPNRDLIVAVDRDSWQLRYFGAPHNGGKGEVVKDPERLSIAEGNLFLSNHRNGQILVLDRQGAFRDAYELRLPGAIAAGKEQFVVNLPGQAAAFARVNNRGRILGQFSLGASVEGHSFTGTLLFDTSSKGEIIVIRDDASQLTHISDNTEIMLYLLPKFQGWPGNTSVREVVYHQNRYHLLLSSKGSDYLLTLDKQGKVHHLWLCPMKADGMDLSDDFLVLFHRERGSAQTYRLGN